MRYDKLFKLISEFCNENQISVEVSQNMPAGYENAFGTYDVTVNVLYINLKKLKNASEYECLFYTFHELRHALQYQHPERFDVLIRQSIPYVVLYDGTCFKLTDNRWYKGRLEGTESYLTNVYLNMPYERDANQFAYQQTAGLCGKSDGLDELYATWQPSACVEAEKYPKLFSLIDNNIE